MSAPHMRRDGSECEMTRVSEAARILQIWPFLAFLGSFASGCILPVGPDFHDPPDRVPLDEVVPSFRMAKPQLETVVGYSQDITQPMPFTVDIFDLNLRDSISVRWIANYPRYTSGSTKVINTTTVPPETDGVFRFSNLLDCTAFPRAADKSLAIVVSDRDFVDDTVPTDQENRYSYYRDDDGNLKQTFVVGTWRIAGCIDPP